MEDGAGAQELDTAGGHAPVLCAEALAMLDVKSDGFYIDATLGRAGHAREIAARLGPQGRLLAIDRDPDAVAHGRKLFAADPRVTVVHASFSGLAALARAIGREAGGVLVDLGVSSPQLDDPRRGFSFRESGPLDMRLDPTRGTSVRDWLLVASEQEIAGVIRDYGEERAAFQIAQAIVARRVDAGADAFRDTTELARLVAGVVRRRSPKRAALGKDPATRTFQSFRIHINGELEELSLVLNASLESLAPGARLAVISFHSLEDRLVKQFIAHHCGTDAPRDPIRGGVLPGYRPALRRIARVLPDAAEVQANPRARSAVLRIAERLED